MDVIPEARLNLVRNLKKFFVTLHFVNGNEAKNYIVGDLLSATRRCERGLYFDQGSPQYLYLVYQPVATAANNICYHHHNQYDDHPHRTLSRQCLRSTFSRGLSTQLLARSSSIMRKEEEE